MNNNFDVHYYVLLEDIINNGEWVKIGNTKRLTKFGVNLKLDVSRYFPLLNVRKLSYKTILTELLWFLNGDTDLKFLHDNNVHIWDANANGGELGDVYGKQWRDFNGIDQIQNAIDLLIKYPKSTRNVVTAWNPTAKTVLPPCHFSFQLLSLDGNKLSLHCTMRSSDILIGLPFNVPSYTALLYLFCEVANMTPDKLYMSLSHAHIYEENMAVANKLMDIYNNDAYDVFNMKHAELIINKEYLNNDFKNMSLKVFDVYDYQPLPAIPVKMVVT
jgi:thymidylate synthase